MTSARSAERIATHRRNDMMRTAAQERVARTSTQHDARGSVRSGLSTLVTAFARRFATAQPTSPTTAWRSLHDDA